MSRLYLSKPCAFFHYHRTRCCGRSRRPAFPAPFLRRGATNWRHPGEKTSRGNEDVRLTLFEKNGTTEVCVARLRQPPSSEDGLRRVRRASGAWLAEP